MMQVAVPPRQPFQPSNFGGRRTAAQPSQQQPRRSAQPLHSFDLGSACRRTGLQEIPPIRWPRCASCRQRPTTTRITSSTADEFIENMSGFADCSEDDLINITFEVCNTKGTGIVPTPAFIKYVEDVTGYNHENSKLLLLYNMLDPERQNVLIDKQTFLATMKKWITICYQDCIPETEMDECQATTNGNLQHNQLEEERLSKQFDKNQPNEHALKVLHLPGDVGDEELLVPNITGRTEVGIAGLSLQTPSLRALRLPGDVGDEELLVPNIAGRTESAEQIDFDYFNQCNGSITLAYMENKLPDCFSVAQQCLVHQTNEKMDDEKYSIQEEIALDMRNREPGKGLGREQPLDDRKNSYTALLLINSFSSAKIQNGTIFSPLKEAAACCESTSVLPVYFSFLTSSAIHYLDYNNSRLETSFIEALNLEHISTRQRCWTFPNLLFVGQRPISRENLLNKKKHVYKTENGRNNKSRTLEVNSQVSTEDGVKHLHSAPLPNYSAVTQRTWDLQAPQIFSSEVNLKHIFPSVHGLFSPHYNPMWPSVPIMPTVPEDMSQSTETHHHSILPSTDKVSNLIKSPSVEVAICNTPSIVFPENTVIQDTERERNLSLRPISPYLRHSNRHTRALDTSLTSVDNTGHVIDLVNDQLPDVKISDEDKKKNLELLEEAKRVSERFLTRRGRKSRSSLSESPTGMSPTLSPSVSPAPSRSNSFTLASPTGSDTCAFTVGSVSPLQNATKGLNDRKQNDQRKLSQGRLLPHLTSFENPKEKLSEQKENFDPHKLMDNLSTSCTFVGDVGKVSLNSSTNTCEHELGKPFLKITKEKDFPFQGKLQGPGMATVDPKLNVIVPLLKDSKVTCKTELNTSVTRPPLLRAISWDHVEPGNMEKAPFKQPSGYDKNIAIMNKSSSSLTKPSAFKDLQIQVQPVRMQKLTKLREEHILMRNQNLVGLKLPDLSEAAEQERGSSSSLLEEEEEEEEETTENSCDVMPNIPDALLRKLRVHTSVPGSSPPLTEKEVENVFIQLSLAFRNDSYTLESRINQAERERNLAEENTEKELDTFKAAITSSASLWHHSEHREMYQKLLEDITVLHRLASRLSSRAEMVGAVRQEKRMSKATEVMMQYVENLKRTYEKDHAELMEFKKLANQNSNRSYGSPEDGLPRTSRSMSLTVGKAPRRRVSVAVVSKFEIPGQSPNMSPIPLMPPLTESTNGRNNLTTPPILPALIENGKSNGDPDCEPAPAPAPAQRGLEEISPEMKAKIEEEAYNKGYREGLKKTRELDELIEEDEEKIVERPDECEKDENDDETGKHSKLEVVIHYIQILCPKLQKHWNVLWIVAAIIIIFAVVLGISSLYNYFSSCAELSDGPQVKATCSAVQQYSWWNSGLQHDGHTE
ncbi:inositol 1,4,5-triphosphate receptor associated 1 [Eublepharis macularius]|uniref:Inositol 1,4,5-triphosphate receptor associated 1 n=1 Tax=Eublepharis macularius TaxID=481883 RepID=A0AA97KQ13_EUBMA|nr:inositol 1,4,5-triphosphate receptor associated 1 [Eublepharis macularius]